MLNESMGPRNSKSKCVYCTEERWKQIDFPDRTVNITLNGDNGVVKFYEGKKKKKKFKIFNKNKKEIKMVGKDSEEFQFDLEDEDKSHIEKMEQEGRKADSYESFNSNSSMDRESSEGHTSVLLSDYHGCCIENDEFKTLQHENENNLSHNSFVIENLKESVLSESYEDLSNGSCAFTDSFKRDVNKEVDLCQNMVKVKVMNTYDEEQLNSHSNDLNLSSSAGDRKRQNASGISFRSLLEDQRPSFPADGADSFHTSWRENLLHSPFSTHNLETLGCERLPPETDNGSLASRLQISFSRSVTGYPSDTSGNSCRNIYFCSASYSNSSVPTDTLSSFEVPDVQLVQPDKKQQTDSKIDQTQNCLNDGKHIMTYDISYDAFEYERHKKTELHKSHEDTGLQATSYKGLSTKISTVDKSDQTQDCLNDRKNIMTYDISYDASEYEQQKLTELHKSHEDTGLQATSCKGLSTKKSAVDKSCQTSLEDTYESVHAFSPNSLSKRYWMRIPDANSISADSGIESGTAWYKDKTSDFETEGSDFYEISHRLTESENSFNGNDDCSNSICVEEDTEAECCQKDLCEIFQMIFESNEYVTVTLRDCSFMAYADFITIKSINNVTLKYRQIVILDIKELKTVSSAGQLLTSIKGLDEPLIVLENEIKLTEKATKCSSKNIIPSRNLEIDNGTLCDNCSFLSISDPENCSDNAQNENKKDSCKNTCCQYEHEIIMDDHMTGTVLKNHFDQQTENEIEESKDLIHFPKQVEKPVDIKGDHVDSKMNIVKQIKHGKHASDMSSRKKKSQKNRSKTFPNRKTSDNLLSDSSLEYIEPKEINPCSYCRRNLDIPNKYCKHHKKIRKPIGEFKDSTESCSGYHNYDGKTLIFKQVSFDSGISSCSTGSGGFRKSLQCRYTHQKAKEVKSRKSSLTKINCIRYKKGKYLYRGKLPSSTFRNATRYVWARERERQIAKEIAREIHVDHRNLIVFGLGSYFDRLNNGNPPTNQERMQYEWLRLATFSNYTGNGNALALSRNGFYHDHEEGPTTTRCYLCDARHSNWEMFDDVNAEHRRQSPNCPFHENSGQEFVNISITSGDNEGGVSVQARTSVPTVTSVNTTVTASSSAAAANEAMRSLQIGQASSSGGESISQQPTEDPESRDRSLLALSQPRTQRALGRTGHSYSTIIAPRRNNVATGARSNVGIDPLGSGSTTSSTGSQVPGIRPSSILGGPVGAGAFAGLNRAGQNTDAQPSVTRATEGLQQSNAPSSSTEAAAGTRQTNPAPGAGGRTDPTITVVVDNPKHPDYVNIDSRVSSYQGWPDYLDQTPRQMSEAGFFFVGVADFTRCFCCGGGLRNWEPGDDPMLEHTRWFPRCEYVNKLKGERYVAAVQRRHQEHMAEQQRQQIEIAQRRDENRNPPDPMTTEAAAVMREMGYSAERTREAILAVRQQTGSAMVTTQQVLTWLLDAEERRLTGNSSNTELGIRPPPMSSSTATSIVDTSTPSSIVYTGTSISSSIVYTGTSIDTSVVNTTSSISAATSIVSAGTTTSTVSSTSTTATAEVQQTGTPAGAESSGTGNQQTGSGNNSSSNSGSGTSVEKQSGASGGDSDESKSAAKENASSSVPTNKTTKKKNAKKKAKNKAAAKSETAGATGGDIDAKSLKAENEKLREMQTCKICMERAVNTTLLPCGHLVCCDTCAARLQRCPICRKRIKGTVKTFMS